MTQILVLSRDAGPQYLEGPVERTRPAGLLAERTSTLKATGST